MHANWLTYSLHTFVPLGRWLKEDALLLRISKLNFYEAVFKVISYKINPGTVTFSPQQPKPKPYNKTGNSFPLCEQAAGKHGALPRDGWWGNWKLLR